MENTSYFHTLNALHNRHLRRCAHCDSSEIYRQRPRGILERHIVRRFNYAPYCASIATAASTFEFCDTLRRNVRLKTDEA